MDALLERLQVQQSMGEGSQLIVVVTPTLTATQGTCYLMDKTEAGWVEAYTFPVVVGRSGFRWGRGLHQVDSDRVKREGDGAAPSGAFSLGTAFGTERVSLNWPYRKTTDRDVFVDDMRSRFYNQWVNLDDVPENDRDWESFEWMMREDGLYRLGLVINHNMDPVEPGMGSAIFFHVWRGVDRPTAGCTAMSERSMRTLLGWVNVIATPMVVQTAL